MSIKEAIGPAIGRLRETLGFSQHYLADKVGVSQPTISRWERGESLPRFEYLITVSEALGITIDELLQEAELVTKKYDLDINLVLRQLTGYRRESVKHYASWQLHEQNATYKTGNSELNNEK